jgi:pilus assembly protein CpaE
VSIEVMIVGSAAAELEQMLRALGVRCSSVALTELLHIAQPGAKPPSVIVLDMRQRTSFPPAVALLKNEHPSTGVVIVAKSHDPALMLEAMRAGVSEWVTDPVNPADLKAAVDRVAGAAAPANVGDLFVVGGAKGGVGTTTVAVNLATTLASVCKATTLLIDVHPMGGDAALFLGADPKFSIIDAIENTNRLDHAYLKGIVAKTASGLDLLAAPDQATQASIDPRRLRAVVEMALRAYRYVIIDAGRFDAPIEETLDLASNIIVVATQELAAIRRGARTAQHLRQRHGADRVDVVLNRYDRSAEIGTEDLERAFKSRIAHRFPSNYRLAIDALNKGRPLVVDNHNKLAGSMAAHARSLVGFVSLESSVDRPAGLLSKFTGRR